MNTLIVPGMLKGLNKKVLAPNFHRSKKIAAFGESTFVYDIFDFNLRELNFRKKRY